MGSGAARAAKVWSSGSGACACYTASPEWPVGAPSTPVAIRRFSGCISSRAGCVSANRWPATSPEVRPSATTAAAVWRSASGRAFACQSVVCSGGYRIWSRPTIPVCYTDSRRSVSSTDAHVGKARRHEDSRLTGAGSARVTQRTPARGDARRYQ